MTTPLYEYQVLPWAGPITKPELDAMVPKGWRLIAVAVHYDRFWHYFERLAQPPSPEVGPNAAAGRDPRDPT